MSCSGRAETRVRINGRWLSVNNPDVGDSEVRVAFICLIYSGMGIRFFLFCVFYNDIL